MNYIPKFRETFPELNKVSSEEICDRWISLGLDFYTEEKTEVSDHARGRGDRHARRPIRSMARWRRGDRLLHHPNDQPQRALGVDTSRMPVILGRSDEEEWLDPVTSVDTARAMADVE